MIRLRGITLARGGTALLESTSATINPGERIALIGRNGSGKSSLMAALCGDVLLDAGDIELPAWRIVRLDQTLPGGSTPAWRHVLAADTTLTQAASALADAQAEGGMALAHALDAWTQADGHSAFARIGELLAGLGFAPTQIDQPIDALSGGWRMRLNLARALFAPGELLLLDEPTNHLDLDAIIWLERWLLRFAGSAVIISHDRDFLDRVAQATLAIEERKLVRYAGGYSAYESQRAARAEQAERTASQQAAKVAHLTQFIDRFRAQATKARQVQSRIKALEKIARVAPLRAARGVEFTLAPAIDAPDPLIVAAGLSVGYGQDKRILSDVEMLIPKGARIGLLGRNGAGKSTLIRTLVGDLPALGGELRTARTLRVGYFAQHGVEALRADDSPLALFKRTWPDQTESALRGELGAYGFGADDALRPIGPMSGGEKARLLLAMILRVKPHLLVLDEPTNHLDANTRDTLTEALADFDGALLLVSHDRYLMRATVDQLALIDDGRLRPFDGDLDDYLEWLQSAPAVSGIRSVGGSAGNSSGNGTASVPHGASAQALRSGSSSDPTKSTQTQATPTQPPLSAKEARRLEAQRRAALAVLLKPIDTQLRKVEGELTDVETELATIEQRFADPSLYDNGREAADLARRRGELDQRREGLESRWLELGEERDRVSAAGLES